MILYTKMHDKVKCIKTDRPRLNSKRVQWDRIIGVIDGKDVKFYFNVKNNRSYFYFEYCNEWYKTEICNSEGFDLWELMIDQREKLYTVLP